MVAYSSRFSSLRHFRQFLELRLGYDLKRRPPLKYESALMDHTLVTYSVGEVNLIEQACSYVSDFIQTLTSIPCECFLVLRTSLPLAVGNLKG